MQQSLLLRCIFDSLSIFGENTKLALLARLHEEGVEFTPAEFNMNKFCIIAEQLLGRSADFIFVKILDEFSRQSKITLNEVGLTEKPSYLSHSGILLTLYSKVKE
jgi:hypothetical protein